MRNIRRIALSAAAIAVIATGCSGTDQTTEVHVAVAPDFSYEGLASGDPVPDATLRLYLNDDAVLEVPFDDTGTAVIAPDPGTYDLQVEAASADPLCFWGDTVFDVTFPSRPITLEVGFICAGG